MRFVSSIVTNRVMIWQSCIVLGSQTSLLKTQENTFELCEKMWYCEFCFHNKQQDHHHCTMRFRKKRAKNVQLWTLVSPRIFIEKLWKSAQSCLNSSRIWDYFFGQKIKNKMGGKSKKLLGVFVQVKIGLKKILSQKDFFFRKSTFCTKTPK